MSGWLGDHNVVVMGKSRDQSVKKAYCCKWRIVEPCLPSILKLVNVRQRCEGNEAEKNVDLP